MSEQTIKAAYEAARDTLREYGVDAEAALKKLDEIPVSLHCWQGDDVTGLEAEAGGVSGGILSTGNYPGKARNGDELRADLSKALSLLPGPHKVNLHASYAELAGEKVDRDAYELRHFARFVDWAKEKGIGLDFNPTYFGHPKAADNLTLSHPDKGIRAFWIEHGKTSRRIAAGMGKALGQTCVTNLWIPDGMKDFTADRLAHRARLKDSLDEVYKEKFSPRETLDSVECKLFGIGTESFVVGSHEFYMGYLGYAHKNGFEDLMLTLDMGHFHPTEQVSDKLSSLLLFSKEILLHLSRGVRWDSDHVIVFSDEITEVMRELVRADALDRTHIALDFFDGSINRVTAWVVGARAARRALLAALLEPTARLKELELAQNFGDRLALMDEARTLPVAAVWNEYCRRKNLPGQATQWLSDVADYEKNVLSKRV